MKKNYILLIVTILLSTSINLVAEVLATENFEYAENTELVGNGWTVQIEYHKFPFTATGTSLTHPTYMPMAIGRKVNIGVTGQDAYYPFSTVIRENAVVYAAMLINVATVTNRECPIYFGEGTGISTFYGGLLIKKHETDGKIKFGIFSNTYDNTEEAIKSIAYDQTAYDYNTTYLIVLKYETKMLNKDGIASLFVEPTNFTTEPTASAVSLSTQSGKNFEQLGAIYLRQGSAENNLKLAVSSIKVATTWENLFPAPVLTPQITITPNLKEFGSVYANDIPTTTFVVKGENLIGDITITPKDAGHPEAQLDVTTISKEDAEAPNGKMITLTLTPTNSNNGYQTSAYTFSTTDATDKDFTFSWNFVPIIEFASIKAARDHYDTSGSMLIKIMGPIAVSHSYVQSSNPTTFMQDATAAITIQDKNAVITTPYVAGDRIASILGTIETFFGSLIFVPMADFGTPITNTAIIPETVTFEELKATPAAYEAKLIKIERVSLGTTGTFQVGSQISMTQNGLTGINLRVLAGADFINTEIPTTLINIVGISTNKIGNAIAPRFSTDMEILQPTSVENDNLNTLTITTANQTIYLHNIQIGSTIKLFNLTGSILLSTIANQNELSIPITSNGIYLLQVNKKYTRVIVQ